jgi:hypothetical protein
VKPTLCGLLVRQSARLHKRGMWYYPKPDGCRWDSWGGVVCTALSQIRRKPDWAKLLLYGRKLTWIPKIASQVTSQVMLNRPDTILFNVESNDRNAAALFAGHTAFGEAIHAQTNSTTTAAIAAYGKVAIFAQGWGGILTPGPVILMGRCGSRLLWV